MQELDSNKHTYSVAFIPSDPVYSEVKQLSQYVRKQYRAARMSMPEPRIALIDGFNWTDNKEYLLIDALKRFASNHFPIDIDIQHFGYRRNETIYVRLAQESELINLRTHLKNHFDTTIRVEYLEDDNKEYVPCISIGCETLPKTTVNRAWNEFKNRHFEASFIGSRLALIRHEKENSNVVAEFDLC